MLFKHYIYLGNKKVRSKKAVDEFLTMVVTPIIGSYLTIVNEEVSIALLMWKLQGEYDINIVCELIISGVTNYE